MEFPDWVQVKEKTLEKTFRTRDAVECSNVFPGAGNDHANMGPHFLYRMQREPACMPVSFAARAPLLS